jgi:hypothetical protein
VDLIDFPDEPGGETVSINPAMVTHVIEAGRGDKYTEIFKPSRLIGGVPHVFDVRNEAWDDDEVLRPVTKCLVRNMDVATLGIADFRVHC